MVQIKIKNARRIDLLRDEGCWKYCLPVRGMENVAGGYFEKYPFLKAVSEIIGTTSVFHTVESNENNKTEIEIFYYRGTIVIAEEQKDTCNKVVNRLYAYGPTKAIPKAKGLAKKLASVHTVPYGDH